MNDNLLSLIFEHMMIVAIATVISVALVFWAWLLIGCGILILSLCGAEAIKQLRWPPGNADDLFRSWQYYHNCRVGSLCVITDCP